MNKGARFCGFRCSRVRGVLGGISSIPLDLACFVGPNLGYGVPMRCFYYPKILCKSVEQFRRSVVGFGGVDPRVPFIPRCPGVTGLTGASDRSDRCVPFVGFASGELLISCVFGSCWFWSVLGCFGGVCVGFFFRAGCVFWGVFVPGPGEVTEALWNICCAAVVSIGLTGSVHQSDWCHGSDRRRPSV
jgi:hypothetical protein